MASIDTKAVLEQAEAFLAQEKSGGTKPGVTREKILSAVRQLFVYGEIEVQEIGPHTRDAFLRPDVSLKTSQV